jgi:hypothetical protein
MDREAAYRRVLECHPDLASGLAAATAILARPPVTSLFLTGGVALGSYSPAGSDVDIVAVLDKQLAETEVQARSRAVWTTLPNASLTLLMRHELGQDQLPALQVWAPDNVGPYPFHAMEVILLRDHSVLLWGADCRRELPKFSVREAISETIAHVADRMLPPILATIAERPLLPNEASHAHGVAMVMVRCLYTLRTEQLTSKPHAAQWVTARSQEPPALRRLAQLLTQQHERGPGAVSAEEMGCLFSKAAAEFAGLRPPRDSL